ncbi:Shedu anti-phage system protein SduA domain-containing protein [Vibrio diabolicus]|uniref:Shedu anti-phage system protein SduA domain-containing protein n=1 Tax=Vibrio diabolicus TaxID=50719 RepID=UPI0035A8D7F4
MFTAHQQNIAAIKNNNRLYDIESYAVHCILIIGTIPDDEDKKKSFEIYRRNSKNVQIITFDELLLKLKQLHEFLGNNEVTQ